ncbi:MAG: hypothetical protein BWY82_01893 [Verrucomicrobia bacterium ADurb.Bin474]|nr:MAG: hypothetical protein BWY82_01893 [Verrucomicrobia bacterium ADurb.Bin474]
MVVWEFGNKEESMRKFTMIEIGVVMAIIALLATIVVFKMTGGEDASKANKAVAMAEALNIAQQGWDLRNPNGTWPASTKARYEALTAGGHLPGWPVTWAEFVNTLPGYLPRRYPAYGVYPGVSPSTKATVWRFGKVWSFSDADSKQITY